MNNLLFVIAYLAARLQEPGTWASIAAGEAAVGVYVPPGTWQAVVGVGTGLAVLAGILLKERGGAAWPPSPAQAQRNAGIGGA